MDQMHNLNDMYLFAKVVEHGGYSAASRAVGVATPRLSRRVSELERRLGIRLINRTTRSISLSDAGLSFYRHCVTMIEEAQAACEAVEKTRTAPRGLVRLSCPAGLASGDIGAVLARYMADHPAVRLRLETTDRQVDVVEEGFDVAIRASFPPLVDSELVTRTLATVESTLVCSPWFIAQRGELTSMQALSEAPTLTVSRPDNRYTWTFIAPDGAELELPHTPRLVTDDCVTLRRAALEGLGIALLPRSTVRQDLADGALVEVLQEWKPMQRIVHLVFPSRKGLVPAVRSLIDALVNSFAGGELPAGPRLRKSPVN